MIVDAERQSLHAHAERGHDQPDMSLTLTDRSHAPRGNADPDAPRPL